MSKANFAQAMDKAAKEYLAALNLVHVCEQELIIIQEIYEDRVAVGEDGSKELDMLRVSQMKLKMAKDKLIQARFTYKHYKSLYRFW